MTTSDPVGPDHGRGAPRVTTGAGDGSARIHFPGGRLRPGDWTALARLAADLGSDLHVTPRGGLGFHGVFDHARLRERATAAGLVPATDRVGAIEIVASPLAGLLDGRHDLAGLIDRLDAAAPELADVVTADGSVLLGLDDGSGDVLAHAPDVTVAARPGGRTMRFHVAGRDTGIDAPTADVPTVLVDAWGACVDAPTRAPRESGVGVLHDLVVAIAAHPATVVADSPEPAGPTPAEVPPVGWVDTSDGLVSLLAVVPHDVIPVRLAEFLGAVERPGTVSADRVIGLHGLTEGMAEQVVRVLAPMGMVFDAAAVRATGD